MKDYAAIRGDSLEELGRIIAGEGEGGSAFPAERLAEIREKLLTDSFHVVIMGRFKRGKTTLINALLGDRVLPSAVVPLTSVNTVVRYGEEPGVKVSYLDGRSQGVGIEDLHVYVTEKGNARNRLGVRLVDVYYPSTFLKDGVCLVDTPGTGSTYLHNDETTYAYLSHADAVIFMISADPPISRSELDFLHRIRMFVDKIFFVLNKVDYLEPADLEESILFNRQALCEALAREDIPLYPLSARRALEAAISRDGPALRQSGLPDFVAVMQDFLAEEKGRILLESSIRNARKAVADAAAGVELEMTLLLRPREDLQRKMEAFREQIRLISGEREELRYLMDGDYRALLRDGLDAEVEKFRSEAERELLRRYDAFFEERSRLSTSELLEALSSFVREEIREAFSVWRYQQERRLEAGFDALAAKYRGRVNAIANRILETAGELFGVAFPRLDAELSLSEEGEFWFKLEDVPSDLEILMSTLAKSLPKKLSHRWLKKSKRDELTLLFDRHCGRVRYDFQLRLQKSMNLLSLKANEVIEETLKSIELAIENARQRLDGEREELEAAAAGLEERYRRLEQAGRRLDEILERISADTNEGGERS